jgi:outer membrane lipoprotein-sorting protein
MNCPTLEALAELALGAPAGSEQEHVARCPICAARLVGLRALVDRLESAQAVYAHGHDVGRARLLAALATEPVPVRPHLIRRIVMDRRTWAASAAVAAAAIVVVLFGWGGSAPVALADVLKPFREAKSYSCEMVPVKDGKLVPELPKFSSKVTWAAPGSLRMDNSLEGKPVLTTIVPHDRAGVFLHHSEKTYQPHREPRKAAASVTNWEDALITLFDSLRESSGGDQKPTGIDDIDGVKAPRFDLTIDLAGPPKIKWQYRLWAHPETKRPMRVEFKLGADQAKETMVLRLQNFEWDVKTEGLFDTTPPKGYRLAAASTPDEANERTSNMIVAFLRAYRDLAGGYPKTDSIDVPKVAEELGKLAKKKLAVEVDMGLVMMGVLQTNSKEAIYRGKTVGPDDKTKVLFRWKLDGGKYRVIFGDLKAETMSADKLKELEEK